MNIAMFTDAYFPRINGVSISVSSYAKELIKHGHKVLVVTAEYPETQNIESIIIKPYSGVDTIEDSVPVLRIPSIKVIISKEDRLARVDQWFYIKRTIDAFKPDIIHVNSEIMIGYYGAMYARHRHVAMVFTFHTLWEDYIKGYLPIVPSVLTKKFVRDHIRFYLRYATEIIAPTDEIKQVVGDYNIENCGVHLLPTGISDSFFKNNKKKTEILKSILLNDYPKLVGKKILLYVGRIAKEKNLDFLLDVIETIHKTHSNTVLLFVGAGPYLDDLKQHCIDRKLSDFVVFTGYMNRSDLPSIYRMAKVFVFASKTETQGLVTAEAMLCGIPVVAIGIRGTLDVMAGDNGGFMVEDSLEDFCNKTTLLLDNDDLYKKKCTEASNWGKKWTIESMTPRLLEIYKQAKTKQEEQNTKW